MTGRRSLQPPTSAAPVGNTLPRAGRAVNRTRQGQTDAGADGSSLKTDAGGLLTGRTARRGSADGRLSCSPHALQTGTGYRRQAPVVRSWDVRSDGDFDCVTQSYGDLFGAM